MTTAQIAKVAHEMNRAYCMATGDNSQPTWEEAPEWQKSSAIMGVEMHLKNPDATPEDSHKSWLKQKEEEGWKYGPVKNPETKEHPCYIPYNELPEAQKAKDYIFRQTVHSLAIYHTPVSDATGILSEGEYRVRTKFNPSATGTVDQIKQAGAKLINLINDFKLDRELTTRDQQSLGRLKSLAMTEVEHGVSDGVKAATVGL